MKQVVFAVNEKLSYVKSLGWPTVKPNVKLPLIVPLIPGGTISLTIDEKNCKAFGEGSGLRLSTDRFAKSSNYNITGNLQTFKVWMSNLELVFDPKTGHMSSVGCYTYVMGEPLVGGAGALATWYHGPSSLLDGNSPSFDIADGLGCGGGLILEVGSGNPTDFIIHIEATVEVEDADGDGKFEVICPTGVWKNFVLEYDPPKFRIIVPDRDPRFRRPSSIDVIQAIRFPDLLKLVKNRPPVRGETARIDRIELVGAPNLLLIFFDSNGNICGGSISQKATRVIELPSVDLENLLIGIVPSHGVGVVRP